MHRVLPSDNINDPCVDHELIPLESLLLLVQSVPKTLPLFESKYVWIED